MSFAYPLVLLLLLAPACLLVHVWRRRGREVVMPFDHGRQSSGRALRAVTATAESVPVLLLAVVVIILAGPQRVGTPKSKRVLTNIEFCVDISGSMTASFGEGSRYDASMEAINEFLDYRSGDAFGLTFFGNSVLHWVPLTTDTSAIRCAPPFMRPEVAPPWFGGTEIAKALRACREVLVGREEGDRMIILVSDGQSWDLDGQSAELARKFADDNIVVYAIHIADSEVPGPIVEITSITGGEIFNPGDPEGLKVVFARIDRMQQTRMEKTLPETFDNFRPACTAGLSLLGAGLLCLFGLRYTPW